MIKSIREQGISNPYEGAGTGASLIREGLWTGSGATGGALGMLSVGITAIGSNSNLRTTAEGFGQQFATGAVANANAGLRWTTWAFRREWGNYAILRVIMSSTSDIRAFIGWSSDTNEIAGETTLNNFHGAGVGKRTADTNWFTMVNDGDATEDRVDTGLAFGTSAVTIELALNSTDFRAKIGTTTAAAVTTELPSLTQDMSLHCQIETGAGAADKNIQIFPIYARSGPI